MPRDHSIGFYGYARLFFSEMQVGEEMIALNSLTLKSFIQQNSINKSGPQSFSSTTTANYFVLVSVEKMLSLKDGWKLCGFLEHWLF